MLKFPGGTGARGRLLIGQDRNRAYSARYGARDPLLAPWPRVAVYLVWRAFVALIRPALFVGLIAAGAWLLLIAVQAAPTSTAVTAPLSLQIEQAFASAGAGRENRRALWLDRVEAALRTPGRAAPDLPLIESYLDAAIAIEGREALAMEMFAQGRRAASVEADLRGRPAPEQAALMAEALGQMLEAGRNAGLEPPAMILAPANLRVRIERARTLYGPTFQAAALWFVEPGGRALALENLPAVQSGAPVLYGDVRDVIVQACAVAQDTGRAVGQCRVGFLPKPQSDPVLAGLSLAVLSADAAARPGARLIKAAYASGRLSPGLARALALGPDPVLGREALLAAVMPVLGEAGEAWTQPVRYEAQLIEAAAEAAAAAHISDDERGAVYAAFGAVRREAGALPALRLAAVLEHPSDAERLAVLTEAAGPPLLALADLDRAQLDALVAGGMEPRAASLSDWPRRAKLQAGAGAAMIMAALALLLGSIAAGALRARGGRPGWFERLDGAVSRLMLGKNF